MGYWGSAKYLQNSQSTLKGSRKRLCSHIEVDSWAGTFDSFWSICFTCGSILFLVDTCSCLVSSQSMVFSREDMMGAFDYLMWDHPAALWQRCDTMALLSMTLPSHRWEIPWRWAATMLVLWCMTCECSLRAGKPLFYRYFSPFNITIPLIFTFIHAQVREQPKPRCLHFDGHFLVSAGFSHNIVGWDTLENRFLFSFNSRQGEAPYKNKKNASMDSIIFLVLAMGADETQLVVGDDAGRLTFYDFSEPPSWSINALSYYTERW